MSRTKPRKWISDRIAQLDPEVDYVEIMRLSTAANDFQMSWFYAVNTPAAGITQDGIQSIYREGRGKYVTQAQKRVDDSVDYLLLWFEHGPDSPATVKSIETVNKLHEYYAKEYPKAFSAIDDYVYILCLNATAVNTSLKSLGLPGFTAKQERAVYLFWSKLSAHFTHVDSGRPVTEIAPFPEDYEGMEKVVAEYMARRIEPHPEGYASTTAALDHFTRQFPRALRGFGRALVTAFMAPEVRKAHSIASSPRWLETIARSCMKLMITAASLAPDPVVPLNVV